MKAEFLKDENGNIWFFFATNIQIRPSKNRMGLAYDIKVSQSQKAKEKKQELIMEIEEYEREQVA